MPIEHQPLPLSHAIRSTLNIPNKHDHDHHPHKHGSNYSCGHDHDSASSSHDHHDHSHKHHDHENKETNLEWGQRYEAIMKAVVTKAAGKEDKTINAVA